MFVFLFCSHFFLTTTEHAYPRTTPKDLQLSKWRSTDQPPGDKGLPKDTVAAMYKVLLRDKRSSVCEHCMLVAAD